MSAAVAAPAPAAPAAPAKRKSVLSFLKKKSVGGDPPSPSKAAAAVATLGVSQKTVVESYQEDAECSSDTSHISTTLADSDGEWSGRWRPTPLLYTSTGPRHANEDRLLCTVDVKIDSPEMEGRTVCAFGVFDGHGGSRCSQWLADNLEAELQAAAAWRKPGLSLPQMLRGALEHAIARAEERYLVLAYREGDHSGACMVLVLYCEGHLCSANVGDCLAALVLPGQEEHVELSIAHRSRHPDEAKRIQAAGGCVVNNRAFGCLEPSRSIGDLDIKRHCRGAVTSVPFIKELVLPPPPQRPATGKKSPALQDSPFIVVASDGVWDVVPRGIVMDTARKSLRAWVKKPAKNNPARMLVRAAIRAGTMDDTTAIVVQFASS